MLKRSDSKNRITAHIRKAKAGIRRHYRMMSVLAVFVALLTMYMLILPAMTLDDSTAQQTPGIEVSAADGGQQEVNETGGETEDRPSSADTEEKGETSEKDEQKTSDDVKTGRKAADRTDSVLKETVETDKGDYEITVKCGQDAGVPEGASLDIEEIEEAADDYDQYVEKSEKALGWKKGRASYIRLFDIKIVDSNKEKVEINAPVDVRIALPGRDSEHARIIHFADDKNRKDVVKGDVIKDVEVEETGKKKENIELSFETEGFSVYAIVDAPEPLSTTVADISELDVADEAFYLSVTRGTSSNYYFKKELSGGCFTLDTDALNTDKWYFEKVSDGVYLIYTKVTTGNVEKKMYMKNTSGVNMGLVESGGTPFEITEEVEGQFLFKVQGQNNWLQYSGSGGGIRLYKDHNNAGNSRITISYASSFDVETDPYHLDGQQYGIAYHDDGATAAGLTNEGITVSSQSRLKGTTLTMKPDVTDNDGILLVTETPDEELIKWEFEWIEDDYYHITTRVGTQKKYLTISGVNVTLEDEPDAVKSRIQAVPGTGQNKGKYQFVSGGRALNLPAKAANGFNAVTGGANTTWMNLVKDAPIDEDNFTNYVARKVSVSDTEQVHDGSQIIIYTRVWNDAKKKYEFFVLDHDGSLIPASDIGDEIEWTGRDVNTALWNFTDYQSGGNPTYYYELVNDYDGSVIAPQMTNDQILSDDNIGVNLNGRRNGQNYTTIIAWDDTHYAYAGLKTQDGHIVSCPVKQADDFYFAIVDEHYDDPDQPLQDIRTVDNNDHGITMKMIDFDNTIVQDRDSRQTAFMGRDTDGTGLLTTDLKDDGYPERTDKAGTGGDSDSLSYLFDETKMSTVNHLFLNSIYNESGYFEYDSTENFAHLQEDGNFKVYDRLGGITGGDEWKVTRTHGQFMPYDDIEQGVYAIDKNGKTITNLTDAAGNLLPDTDPRKGEPLYYLGTTTGAERVNYFFGMQIEASFTQTPSGLDAWGHDIIFEFSGDDDFWLYIDGELALDLGGVHTAQQGTVNFRTGEVTTSRSTPTTLYDIFRNNYESRGMPEDEIAAKLEELFEQNSEGQYVFKDYSKHDMKIFYMERGAGSSNLHMRFNLADVKPGSFILNKTLSGTDDPNNKLLEFPYQIWYYDPDDGGTVPHLLGENEGEAEKVHYKDTNTRVKYRESFTPAGATDSYDHVFFLKPGESAEVPLPDGVHEYFVKECAVNRNAYDKVKANGKALEGTDTDNQVSGEYEHRQDYKTDDYDLDETPRVTFDNHVAEGAMRTLSVTKKLYGTDGQTILHYPDNSTLFNFRIYLGNENDDPDDLPLADMYPYHVKDADGYYCRWNVDNQQFESLGKRDWSALSEAEQESATFTASMNGSVTKIPADHTVEVRNLIITTQYKAEERDYEIPKGYTIRQEDGYTRVDEGREEMHGTTPISGVMEAGEDPEIEVRNQQGWGLTIEKIWTDTDFMDSHDTIYFAAYTRSAVPGSDPVRYSYTMVEDSVRALKTTDTEVYFFFDNLQYGTPFSDYQVFEVALEGDDIRVDDKGRVTGYTGVDRIADGDTLHAGGTPTGGNHDDIDYTVKYEYGTPTLHNENVRTDTATNSRPGIKLYKYDMTGAPLARAEFTLKDDEGHDVAKNKYTSAQDGLITTAYLKPGVYTLTETKAPKGYNGLPGPVTITVSADDQVIIEGPEGLCSCEADPTGAMLAVISARNMTSDMLFRKVDAVSEAGITGAHFALFRQVKDSSGHARKDDLPMPGYEDMVSGANGILTEINTNLGAGTYYLQETQAAAGYNLLNRPDKDLCFTISDTGAVIIESADCKDWLTVDSSGGTASYTVTIPNTPMQKLSVWKTGPDLDTTIRNGATFALYRKEDTDQTTGKPLSGKTPIAEGTTGADGLLELGMVADGEYSLVETRAPAGYIISDGAIWITVSSKSTETAPDGSVTATQAGAEALVCRSGEEHWVQGQDESNWQIRVWNNPGKVLPANGGPGTTWMYILGMLLILGAGVTFAVKRQIDH